MAKELDRQTRKWRKAEEKLKRSKSVPPGTHPSRREKQSDVHAALMRMDKAAAVKGGGTGVWRSTYGGRAGVVWGGGEEHVEHARRKVISLIRTFLIIAHSDHMLSVLG